MCLLKKRIVGTVLDEARIDETREVRINFLNHVGLIQVIDNPILASQF